MRKKEDREIISQIGKYYFDKMNDMGMTLQEFEEYQRKKKLENQLKKKMGYAKYNEYKKSGLSLDDFLTERARKKQIKKQKVQEKKHEKDKIRFRTIRYLERYCDIERKCQICGEWAEIHHPNYKDNLKINLLCKKHHVALHNFELIPPPIIDLEEISIKHNATN